MYFWVHETTNEKSCVNVQLSSGGVESQANHRPGPCPGGGGWMPGPPPLDIQEKNLTVEKYCCNCRKTSNSLGTQENRLGISIKWHY